MKECELCNSPARMYCESDQASLCWECDSKVHSANFLVARHSRSLLCHVCQSPTPWQASGSKLGPTVNVCERCVKRCNNRLRRDEEDSSGELNEEDQQDDDEDEDQEEDESDDDDDDDDGDENDGDSGDIDNDDEDGDNQVVPWSSSTPPPPIASSSSSEDSSTRFYRNRSGVNESEGVFSLKRTRQDDFVLSSSSQTVNIDDSSLDSDRNRIDRKRSQSLQEEHKIVNSIKRFEQQLISGNDASIVDMCRLHKDPRRTM